MAHVNADDHGASVDEGRWERHANVLATRLLVQLLHNVGCDRQVESSRSLPLHELCQDGVTGERLLGHVVVILVVDKEQDGELLSRALELTPSHHLLDGLADRLFELLSVLISALRIIDRHGLDAIALHTDLLLAVAKHAHDVVDFLGRDLAIMHEHNAALCERLAIVDGHLLEEPLVAEQLVLTFLVNELWLSEASALEPERLCLDGDAPLGKLGLASLEQLAHHLVDLLHLLLRVVADLVEQRPHRLGVATDAVGHAVDEAELAGNHQVAILAGLHVDHGLALVRDLQLVLLEEVLGHADLRAIAHGEPRVARAVLEIDLCDAVRLPLAVARHDALVDELLIYHRLEARLVAIIHVTAGILALAIDTIENVVDDVEARLGRHKPVAAVEDEHAVLLIHVGGRLEALPDLHV